MKMISYKACGDMDEENEHEYLRVITSSFNKDIGLFLQDLEWIVEFIPRLEKKIKELRLEKDFLIDEEPTPWNDSGMLWHLPLALRYFLDNVVEEKTGYVAKHKNKRPNAKLTVHDVRTIREGWRDNVPKWKLADTFKVSETTIQKIIDRETWADVD